MGPKLDTLQASTSGTELDFSPPSWVKRVTVMFNQVSTDGSEEVLIQLGDSGGVETSGYVGLTGKVSTSAQGHASWGSTTGAVVGPAGDAADVLSGAVVLSLMDASTNTWAIHGVVGNTGNVGSNTLGGIKPLSAALTTVRITTSGTPDDFDGGSVNVQYE